MERWRGWRYCFLLGLSGIRLLVYFWMDVILELDTGAWIPLSSTAGFARPTR